MAGRVKFLGVVAAVVAVLLALTGASAAQTSPLSASPASAVISDGAATVKVVNGTGLRLALTHSLEGVDGGTVDAPEALEPGGAGSVELSDVALGADDAGTLVITTPAQPGLEQGAVVRVALAAYETVEPAVDAWSIRSSGLGADDASARVPLTGPCEALSLDEPLGRVQGEGRSYEVTGSCRKKDDESVLLRVDDLADPGVYEGTLSLGSTDDDDVELDVTRTWPWYVAATSLVIGVGIALLIQRWTGSGRDGSEVIHQAYLVDHMVSTRNDQAADNQFQDLATKANLPDAVQKWSIRSSVRSETKKARADARRARSAKEIEEAKTRVAELREFVKSWPETANLLAKLRAQDARLAWAKAYRDRVHAATFEAATTDSALSCTTARAVVDKAKEALGVAADISLQRLTHAEQLAAGNTGTAADALTHALGDLAAAETPDVVRARLVDVNAAYLELVRHVAEAARQRRVAIDMAPAAGGTIEPVADQPTTDPLTDARWVAFKRWVIDRVVFVVLLVAALVAGLEALWVDEAFGGTLDVALALVWGLGSTAVTGVLAGAAANLVGSSASLEEDGS